MVLSSTAAILASGFWLILLVACGLFILVAIKGRRQIEDLEQIIDTQRAHIQRLTQSSAQDENTPEEQPSADKEIDSANNEKLIAEQAAAKYEKQIKALMLQIKELKQQNSEAVVDETATNKSDSNDSPDDTVAARLEELEAHGHQLTQRLDNTNKKLALAEKAKSEAIALARSLKQENAVIDAQLKALSETSEVGDAETMREIIINFTEESRELLIEIERLESENKELNQNLQDTESNEKGTTGAVVGLKRKLAEAEEELKLMQQEYQQLKDGKSATA